MLSKLQQEIVETKKSKVVVLAAAASGKTAVLTERVKYLLNDGINPKKIVVITFTNAAADEMRTRIGEKGSDIFIGTIHSYANYLLRLNGENTNKILEDEEFNLLFDEVKAHLDCIKEVDHLLLDEAQDSDLLQFKFILAMIQPKNFFFVGDFRQSIYEFNGSRPDLLIDLSNSAGVKTYDLNENYRNGKEILAFAHNIINKMGYEYEDYSRAMRDEKGKVLVIENSPSNILSTLKSTDEYKDWFILTRTNSQINDICNLLNNAGIPCTTFKRAALSTKGFDEKMKENSVKVLTVHTSKGLEAKNVMVLGVNSRSAEEVRIQYVAATRARDLLIWLKEKPKQKRRIIRWE